MEANRLVKWDGEAQSFFDSVSDNSVVLDLVISHASISQTGHGFEDLVNSINCDELRKKIKKVRITDTAYLYRHCVKDYSGLSVVWFLNNQPSIDKLSVETEINSWEEGFRTDAFERWRRQITEDFSGNNDRLAQKFRELVIANSAVAAQKGTGTFDECVNFILEECAYICAHLKNTVIAYPMPFYDSVNEIIERYNLNIRHLLYKPSSYSRKRSNAYKKLAINQDVLVFLTEAVNANFFIIDRVGNYVYKNNVLSRIVGEAPADIVAPEAWEASINVMNTQKPMVIEERYNEKSYLSVKAPLIIEDEVEGVMGVAIDITDRKKTTELLIKNKEQETKIKDQREFGTFTGQVLHDIASPLASLEYIIKSSDIPPGHHVLLKEITGSIKNIFGALRSKYLEYEKKSNSNQPGFILLSLAFEDILRNKKYEYKDTQIKFNYSFDQESRFTFINGDHSSFSRMISNLINNAVEACDRNSGIVDVSLSNEDGKQAKIVVKDNGVGMPQEIIDKITSRYLDFGSTKHSGTGLGLSQILATVDSFKGTLGIESETNAGTSFIMKFPLADCPNWLVKKLEFQREDIVVILDDDPSVLKIFEELLKKISEHITLKFFTKSADALDFIGSLQQKEKIVFLSGYELRGNDFNGLTVILQSKLPKDRSYILTSSHGDKNLHEMAEKSNVKILLKQFLQDIISAGYSK